jgi:hypothetical protein
MNIDSKFHLMETFRDINIFVLKVVVYIVNITENVINFYCGRSASNITHFLLSMNKWRETTATAYEAGGMTTELPNSRLRKVFWASGQQAPGTFNS